MSMPNPTHFSNSAPPTPDEIDADMEWRQYAPLPSAYPPTPLVGHSAALPPKRPISMGFDAVPENEEDERQDFDRSLLPPREPLNPGSVCAHQFVVGRDPCCLDRLQSERTGAPCVR